MANLSDAGVEIVAEKVGKELIDYINATNRIDTDYAIVYESYALGEAIAGDASIHGSSSGRWAYSNNLEGYFSAERVKDWLGINSDYGWLNDENAKEEYRKQSNEQYEAYLALIEAIKNTDGRIDITYTDCDPAMDWMGGGTASLELVDGEVVYSHSFEEEDLTVAAYAEQQGESEYWALEYLHGEEVAEAYDKYLKECKDAEKEPAEADNWYNEIYEEE